MMTWGMGCSAHPHICKFLLFFLYLYLPLQQRTTLLAEPPSLPLSAIVSMPRGQQTPPLPHLPLCRCQEDAFALVRHCFDAKKTPDSSTPSYALVSTLRRRQTLPLPLFTFISTPGGARRIHALVRLRFDTRGSQTHPCPCSPLFRCREDARRFLRPHSPSFQRQEDA